MGGAEGPDGADLARLRGQRARDGRAERMRVECLELEVAVLRAMLEVQESRLIELEGRILDLERPSLPARVVVRRGLGRGIAALIPTTAAEVRVGDPRDAPFRAAEPAASRMLLDRLRAKSPHRGAP